MEDFSLYSENYTIDGNSCTGKNLSRGGFFSWIYIEDYHQIVMETLFTLTRRLMSHVTACLSVEDGVL